MEPGQAKAPKNMCIRMLRLNTGHYICSLCLQSSDEPVEHVTRPETLRLSLDV